MKQASENFIKLPESELRLMQAVWSLHAAGETDITAAALMAADDSLARLKLTTVLTLITRLINRGFLASEKPGGGPTATRRSSRRPITRHKRQPNLLPPSTPAGRET